ncbi:MAG: DUF4349 domain-containing protein [Deltaproteobacteria bacterium]|nr:DUF4349 domain-containing protein [Deltaproteobacteria bacterium]
MYVRTGLLFALLLSTVGCKKAAMGDSMYEANYDDYGAGDGYGGYEEEEMARASMAPMEDSDGFGSRRRERVSRKSSKRSAPAAAAPPSDTGGDAPPPAVDGEPGEPEPTNDEQPQDSARHIIYTATMQVSVFNVADAMERAESLPAKYGGFIQNMSSNYLVIRIPSANLRSAMDDLGGLGVVDNRTLDAQDVTEEYLDIQTRIDVLESTQKQMMELLTKARTVEEALKVRQALDQITMELEVLKGRLRRLADLVSFSTLTLSLVERGPHNITPSSNDPFPWVDQLGVEATEWK